MTTSTRRLLFREVNERIGDLNSAFGLEGGSYEVFCECSREGCSQRVAVSPKVYAAVRGRAGRFLVAPAHERPDEESVVVHGDGYSVVALRPERQPARPRLHLVPDPL